MANDLWYKQQQKRKKRMASLGITPTLNLSHSSGIYSLAHASFDAGEGDYGITHYIMVSMCTAHIGRMRRFGDGPLIDGVIRPGTIALGLPNTAASGFWPKTNMLGLIINLEALSTLTENIHSANNLHAAASVLHDDPLLTAVMTAMWRDAEVHGLSSAFFDHGALVLLDRFESYRNAGVLHTIVRPLAGRRLNQVLDLIESRIGQDLRVIEMAALAQQNTRTFTRSFSAATGFAPYEYFTLRRMEHAQQLLRNNTLSITEISQQVGYANPSKFTSAFRRTYSVTPSVWRYQQGL